MALLESIIPQISIATISLISVYIFDMFYIYTDNYVSPFVKNLLEKLLRKIGIRYKFRGFFGHIPNFIYLILSLWIMLPFLINFGLNIINPVLQNLLRQSILYFILTLFLISVLVYAFFRQFYYFRLKREFG